MELLFEQEVTGRTTRLILRMERELDQFALQMISHNEIMCFAPLEAVWYNNENYLQYDITGMVPLSSRLSAVLIKSEVLSLLGSLINGFEETDAYMLWEKNLYLNMDYIFVDGEDKCVFLYLPFELDGGMDQISFLQQVTERILPNYEEKDPYLFHILNAFNRGAVKELTDLKEILRKNSVEEESLVSMTGGVGIEPQIQPFEARQPECKQPEQKQSELNLPRSEKKAPDGKSSEKSRVPEAAGVSFAIPGKSGSFPVNIPEKGRGFSGIRLFGKKEKDSSQKARIVSPAAPMKEAIWTERDEDMYESYAQTVMMASQGAEKAVDFGATETICLENQSVKAELIRERTGECLQIMPEGTILGSGSKANCLISGNKAISRSHASIQMQNGAFYITDNNSSNGTWVNENRLISGKPVEVVDNTRIRLANEDFTFIIQ